MGIDNTTKRMQDPAAQMLFLGASMGRDGASGAIGEMEAQGQQQLVNSDRLPSDFGGNRAEWEALGFTFGEPDPDDPLFMPATLPDGWRREGSDHAMWSYLLDQHGRQRAGIFYKAAFYDRKAHMHLVGLHWYVTSHVEYDGPMVITGEWATREAVLAAMRANRDENLREAAEFRGYAADAERRDERNRAGCADTAAEREATAAKYEAAIAELEAQAATDG